MKLERTCSSRKGRRKNDMGREWSDLRSSLEESGGAEGGKRVGEDCASRYEWGKRWIFSHMEDMMILCIGLGCGVGYYYYVSCLFENSTRFSHLTNAEREVSLPVDVAFRYSFFKRMGTESSFIQGIRTVTSDGGKERGSSFHRYSLGSESLYAGVFHLFKLSATTLGLPLGECTILHPDKLNARETSRRILSDTDFGSLPGSDGKSGDFGGGYNLFNASCSGLRDPLEFYLAFTWALEALVVMLIFFTGHQFSCSIFGGICSVILFGLLHPQRTNYNYLFPSPAKVGWIFGFTQIYTIGQTAFSHVHPSWRAAPKIGVSTGLLILFWNTDSQWFLLSQLLIVAALHVFGYLSRYVTSLIVFGQFTGWQYATLVTLDPAMHHWSLFLYVLVGTVLTLFVAEPVIDWILGAKSSKWSFMRRTILVFVFQLVLFSARCDFGRYAWLVEDIRFPLSLKVLPDNVEKWADVPLEGYSGDDSGSSGRLIGEMTKGDRAEKFDMFLRLCFLSRVRWAPLKFLCKYFFILFAALYSILTALILPSLTPNARLSSTVGDNGGYAGSGMGIGKGGDGKRTIGFTRTSGQGGGGKREEKLIKKAGNLLWSLLSLDIASFPSSAFPLWSSKEKDEEVKEENGWRKEDGEDLGERWWRKGEGKLWDAFIVVNVWETLAFSLLAIFVDKSWELFLVAHISLLISCLCDFKKVSRGIKALEIKYADELHMGICISILGIIIASARVRSQMMHYKSRGRFEIGNARVVNLVEALEWIEEKVGLDSNFSGADNLMVALKMLTPRRSVTPLHLTVHSWGNGGRRVESVKKSWGREGSGGSWEDFSEEEASPKVGDDGDKYRDSGRLRYKWSLGRGRQATEGAEGGGGRGVAFEWDSGGKNVDDEPGLNSMGNSVLWMTSRLGDEERTKLLKVYSMYSRRKLIGEFHEDLLSMQVTHLFLSRAMCGSGKSDSLTRRPILPSLHTTSDKGVNGEVTYGGRSGSSKMVERSGVKERGRWRDELIFQPEDMMAENTSVSGSSWHWEWNWQEPMVGEESGECQEWDESAGAQFKPCDMTYFWDTLERFARAKSGEANDRAVSERVLEIRGKFSRNPEKAAKIEKREGESGEEEPLVCRLINERNVLPFRKVFENSMFSILTV